MKPKAQKYQVPTNFLFLDVLITMENGDSLPWSPDFGEPRGEVGNQHEARKINKATVIREYCSNCFKFHLAVLNVS